MGAGLWDGRWDAEAGNTAMPGAAWSNMATSWGKLDISHPLCSPPSPCPAITPLPSSGPGQRPCPLPSPLPGASPSRGTGAPSPGGRPSAPG